MLKHFSDPKILLLVLAGVTYAVFVAHLTKIAMDDHEAKMEGRPAPESFPDGYFLWLSISLVSLTVTGAARADWFIILTRGFTFLCVVLVYAVVKNRFGIFVWRDYRWHIISILSLIFVGGTILAEAPEIYWALRDNDYHSKDIANYGTIALMAVFFWRGQRVTAKAIWANFRDGKYNQRGFLVQINRLANFVLQASYYGLTYGMLDAICISSIMGAVGALWIICNYIRKFLYGWMYQIPEVSDDVQVA